MRLSKVFALAAALALAASSASAQSVLRDAEMEQWLEDHSFPLFRAAGLEPKSITLLIIGDDTPNAFAGGLTMGIHTGTFTTADTPNEIEGVIAHEAGHIAGGHSQRSSDAAAAASRPIILSLLLAAGAVAAGAPEAGIGLLGLGQNIAIGEYLTYSRGQESAADQAAVRYLDSAGKSSRGLIQFFGKLRNEQIIRGFKVAPYLQSHPLAVDRMTALEARAKASPHYADTDSPEEIARLKRIKGKIRGFLQEPNVTLRQYPLTDQTDEAHYARAVAYYRNADLDRGLKEVDTLIAEDPVNPYFQELKGQMLFEFGKVAESVAPHQRSVDLAPNKALLRINLGRALAATEDAPKLEQAVKELKAALTLEPDNAFGWFELARAYGSLNEEGLANYATAESRYYVGKRAEAAQFARRAKETLKPGTPEWRRANDILLSVAPNGPGRAEAPGDEDAPSPDRPDKRGPDEVPDPTNAR